MAHTTVARITAERGDELFALARRWDTTGSAADRGALELLTPERARRAAALVIDGTVVSCGRDLAVRPGVDNPNPVLHHMVVGGAVNTAGFDRFDVPSTVAIELRYEYWPFTKPFVPIVRSLRMPSSEKCPFSCARLLKIEKCGIALKFFVTV